MIIRGDRTYSFELWDVVDIEWRNDLVKQAAYIFEIYFLIQDFHLSHLQMASFLWDSKNPYVATIDPCGSSTTGIILISPTQVTVGYHVAKIEWVQDLSPSKGIKERYDGIILLPQLIIFEEVYDGNMSKKMLFFIYLVITVAGYDRYSDRMWLIFNKVSSGISTRRYIGLDGCLTLIIW